MSFSQVFPYVIIGILMYMLISRPVVTNTIEVPAKSGSFTVDKPQPIVHYDTIYKDKVIEKIVVRKDKVDTELLAQYKKANDSLKLALFIDRATVRDYRQVFRDMNQEITISSKVIGSLEKQDVDYTIHSTQIPFKNPTEGFYIGVGASSSYRYLELPSMSVNFSIIKNKRIYSTGVNTNNEININIQQRLF